MTRRDRAHAELLLQRFAAASPGAPLIPTAELRDRVQAGDRVVFVDVRAVEEQRVSMIPGAVTVKAFEADILPGLQGEAARVGTLVVPYCTCGYRSALYCRRLVESHGLGCVRNGEGVIMWTFEGGSLVRPSRARLEAAADTAVADEEPTTKVHVYGKMWDCAADGFTTVYLPAWRGAVLYVVEACRKTTAKLGTACAGLCQTDRRRPRAAKSPRA
mmetsp:Transcript_44243/g.127913  ORF Transcript_44243/g.127913 Transcript_44243/m.127913 type:complete len:216 (+) Transcript_44243:65-712(+)